MLPRVLPTHAGCQWTMAPRRKGILTGSRLAGVFGRIHVELTFWRVATQLEPMGFELERGRLRCASYVDNLFSVRSSAREAVRMLDVVAAELHGTWGFDLKESSRQWMVARDGEVPSSPMASWKQVTEMEVLGAIVQDSGHTSSDWRATQVAAWRSCWSTCCSPRARALHLPLLCRTLDRCVRPVVEAKSTKWPSSAPRLRETGQLQRRCIRRLVSSSVDSFRCSRASRAKQRGSRGPTAGAARRR